MQGKRGATALVLLSFTCLTACTLFKTNDDENAAGRGPKAFDPYSGAASGALRLGLQMYNGCAILATGEPVGKGAANIDYPATCDRAEYLAPVPPVPPAPMPLEAGATYFLNQITLEEVATGLHKDPSNMAEVADWMKNSTRFSPLDWGNLGVIADRYIPAEESQGPDIWDHQVAFGNANWQTAGGDTYFLEVLNADGQPVQSFTYDQLDFLATNETAGHTQLRWTNSNIAAPAFPGDLSVRSPPDPGVNYPPPAAIAYHSRLRIDMILATHPTKSFKLDDGLVGDGAIRLTWSQMPLNPFIFPVTFIKPADLPATCLKGSDPTQKVQCNFGLKPEVTIVPPANGQFFLPGDQIHFKLAIKDGDGNYLHDPDHLPTYNEAYAGNSNGILYLSGFGEFIAGEADSVMAFSVAGPHQAMRPSYEFGDEETFFTSGTDPMGVEIAFSGAFPGAADAPIATERVITLPTDAKFGTYTAFFKAHRQFLGERFTKIGVADFQVGQNQKTLFPGRVGNCQICHRGTISMENVRHGLPVDYVEGCKTCHSRNDANFARTASMGVVHAVHVNSPKYPQQKNNCTFCHLTKESALRPSYFVCASCHPQPHGTEFWGLQFESDYSASNRGVFANCAQQCHGQTPPTAHILPSQ